MREISKLLGSIIILLLVCQNGFANKYPSLKSNEENLATQQIEVSGFVKDNNGLPLSGVSALVKGSLVGTITDINGQFKLTNLLATDVLVFSFIGMNNQEVTVGTQTILNIIMQESIVSLDEVLVVGYGVTKKSNLTSAVASVNMKEMKMLPVQDLGQALQGRASGGDVIKSSGAPGAKSRIYVRGPGSVNGTDPLFVVDGIPISGTYDQNDVESIEVLKDASAAAIYGARAANGVVLITTRRGKEGKPVINFSTYQGFSSAMNLPKLATSAQYAKYKDESFINGGFNNTFAYHKIALKPDTLLPVSTDWMKELFGNGRIQNYTFDISGGNKTTKVYSSMSYNREDGTYLNTYFERLTLTFNMDSQIKKWISIGNSLNVAVSNNDDGGGLNMRVNPFMKVFDSTLTHPYEHWGQLTEEYGFQGGNPVGAEYTQTNIDRNYNLVGSVYLDIKPIKGLTWRTTLGGDLNNNHKTNYRDRYDDKYIVMDKDYISDVTGYGGSLVLNSIATYDYTLNKHNFSLMVGTEFSHNYPGYKYEVSGKDVTNGKLTIDNTDLLSRTANGSRGDEVKWLSYFSRLAYNYSDKYLFTFTLRSDETSKFAAGVNKGLFPSFSGAWRLTKEPFTESVARFADIKIRAGYGAIGNATFDNNFPYLATVNPDNYYYTFGDNLNASSLRYGLRPNGFANASLTWESVYTTNIGIDWLFFKNRLEINTEWYMKNTKDMLIPVDLPISAGLGTTASTLINVGSVKNTGYDFHAQYKDKEGDFTYSVGANISVNKNEVLKLNADESITQGDFKQFYTAPRLPISSYQGYQVDGLWQQTASDSAMIIARLVKAGKLKDPTKYNAINYTGPGDLKYVDQNGDSIIDINDLVNLGNSWPKMTYGFNLYCEYKGFDATVFLQGVYGNDIYNLQKRSYQNTYGDNTFTQEIVNRWSPDNPSNTNPRLTYADPNKNLTTSSSYFVEDGSYMRLKNIVIGYSLPESIMKKSGFTRCRLYISAQNLMTFTKYSGMDPEISGDKNLNRVLDAGMYPQSRTYTIGVQVSM